MPPSRRGWTSFGSDMWLTAGSIGRLPDPDIPGKGTPLFNLCRDLTTGARRVSGCRDTIRGCVPQSDLRPDVRRLGGVAFQRRLRAVQAVPNEVGEHADWAAPPLVAGFALIPAPRTSTRPSR